MSLYCRAPLNYAKGVELTPVEVDIYNGRDEVGLSWQENGFELLEFPSEVTDWNDPAQLETVHYDETERLARELTGCDWVLYYPTLVRSPTAAKESEDYAPVQAVHSDYTETYWKMIANPDHPYHAILKPSMDRAGVGVAEIANAKRIATLQFWRSIGPTEMDFPMCFADSRSVKREGLFPFLVEEYGGVPARFESFVGMLTETTSEHRWFTFPQMTRDESVLFCCYDSDRVEQGLPFWTLHTAFSDPTLGTAAQPRESIESRAVCIFAG